MRNLTKTESLVLYRKYISSGLNPFEASKKLERRKEYLRRLQFKLRKKGKSDKDIEKVWKMAWEKICQEDEI